MYKILEVSCDSRWKMLVKDVFHHDHLYMMHFILCLAVKKRQSPNKSVIHLAFCGFL